MNNECLIVGNPHFPLPKTQKHLYVMEESILTGYDHRSKSIPCFEQMRPSALDVLDKKRDHIVILLTFQGSSLNEPALLSSYLIYKHQRMQPFLHKKVLRNTFRSDKLSIDRAPSQQSVYIRYMLYVSIKNSINTWMRKKCENMCTWILFHNHSIFISFRSLHSATFFPCISKLLGYSTSIPNQN